MPARRSAPSSDSPRRVVFLRHGKSSWDDPSLADEDRPLASRGRQASERMGAYMRAHGLVPSLVLCSPALRARQTWELAEKTLASDARVSVEVGLYDEGASWLLARLRELDDDELLVVAVGHETGIDVAARRLAGDGDTKLHKRMARKFPTAAIAVIGLSVGRWRDVEPGCGRLERFVKPKDLA